MSNTIEIETFSGLGLGLVQIVACFFPPPQGNKKKKIVSVKMRGELVVDDSDCQGPGRSEVR